MPYFVSFLFNFFSPTLNALWYEDMVPCRNLECFQRMNEATLTQEPKLNLSPWTFNLRFVVLAVQEKWLLQLTITQVHLKAKAYSMKWLFSIIFLSFTEIFSGSSQNTYEPADSLQPGD